MNKVIIGVGTTSDQKIGYLKEVLKELGVASSIKSFSVKSGVSEQPITSVETKKGSINRAKNTLRLAKNTDFVLGIEVGYHKYLKNKYEIFCWVTIIDKDGHQLSGKSHSFLLPEYHQKVLRSGKYLGDHLNGYSKKNKNSVDSYMEEMLRSRKPFITSALKDVLLRYIKREDY